MSYSFDYVATGATAEKQVENTDGRCEVGAPGDAWWLTLIGKGDAKANAKDATLLDVPLWRPAMVVSEAMVNGLMTPPDEMLVLSGITHAQTLSYTLDNAGTQGFGVGMVGTVSELALAHALGKHAKPLWTGPHVSPWTVYDDDWVAVDNPTFDGEFQWLQGWRVGHIQEGRALRILFILPWLLKNLTPNLDLDDDESTQVVVLRALAAAGRSAFPTLVGKLRQQWQSPHCSRSRCPTSWSWWTTLLAHG